MFNSIIQQSNHRQSLNQILTYNSIVFKKRNSLIFRGGNIFSENKASTERQQTLRKSFVTNKSNSNNRFSLSKKTTKNKANLIPNNKKSNPIRSSIQKNQFRKSSYLVHKMKLIQSTWRKYLLKKQEAAQKIQGLLKGYFIRKILNEIKIQNEAIEKIILIIKTVCFAHCFDIKYKSSEYVIRRKAKEFLMKIIIIQRNYRRHNEIQYIKNIFWNNYYLNNLIRRRVIMNGLIFINYSLSMKRVKTIQKAIRSFLIMKLSNKIVIRKLRKNGIIMITKTRKSSQTFTKIIGVKPIINRIKVLLIMHHYFTKTYPKYLYRLVFIQKKIKQFLLFQAYKRRIKTVPLKAKEINLVITKKSKLNKITSIISIQTNVRLLLFRKNCKHLRFNKTILMPSIYTKRYIIKTQSDPTSPQQLICEIQGKCRYFLLKVFIVIQFVFKRKYWKSLLFKMNKTQNNQRIKRKNVLKVIKKPIQWDHSLEDFNYSYDKGNNVIENDKFFNDEEDKTSLVVNSIKQLQSIPMFKHYTCSNKLNGKNQELDNDNAAYASMIKLKQNKEPGMNYIDNSYDSDLYFEDSN